MVITLEQAKKLEIGNIIYHISNRNADSTRQRWKVNGKPKLWKRQRNQHRVLVPIKHGLYTYDYLDETNLQMFTQYDDRGIDMSIFLEKQKARQRHLDIKEVLSIFPESNFPITLIGTIATAYNLNVEYTQNSKTIIVKEKME